MNSDVIEDHWTGRGPEGELDRGTRTGRGNIYRVAPSSLIKTSKS